MTPPLATQKLNQAYAVLSQCQRLLIQSGDEAQLLNGICRLLVTEGGYPRAWIGLVDAGGELGVRVAARHDLQADDLAASGQAENIQVFSDGPALTAIQSGQAQTYPDLRKPSPDVPWMAAAAKRGFHACCALPITLDGERLGALCLYDEKDGTFGPGDVELLQKLADDLAFGLVGLRLRKAHEDARQRLELALRGGDLGLWDWHVPSGHVTFNERWCSMLGYRPEEIQPSVDSWSELVHPDDRAAIDAALTPCLRGETELYECEHRLRHKDGHWVWILDRGRVVERDPTGRAARITGTHLDLSRQKQLQAALEKTLRQLNEAQRLTKVGSWELDIPEGRLSWSDEIFRIFELDPTQFQPSYEAFLAAIHPEDRTLVDQAYSESLAKRTPYEISHRLRLPDGRIKYVQERCETVFDSDGQPRVSTGTVQDITERTLAIQALRDSEALTTSIFENAAVGLAMVSLDGRFRKINRRFCEIIGYDADEMLGQSFRAITHPDDFEPDWDQVKRLIDGLADNYALEKRYIHKTGHLVWVNLWVHIVREQEGRPAFFISAVVDITERKTLEHTASELLSRLQKISARIPGVVYQFQRSPDGRYSFPYASEGMRAIYGVAPETVLADADAVFQVLHPEDLPRIAASFEDSARQLSAWHEQYRVIHADGRVIWVEGEATPEALADGSVLWHGHIHEITERKAAEEQLHLAASVFEFANEGIIITDRDGHILDVNRAFTEITGYPREEALNRNPRLLKSGHHDPAFYEAMWGVLKQQGYWIGEIWNRRKNGELYAEMLTISAVLGKGGEILRYVGLFSDITSIKEHQRQLEYIAHYDALTQLPNRMLLTDRLHQAMAQAERHQRLLAVAYLDLDAFKPINDNYGHDVGDKLLRALAERMKQILRDADTLARIGGDEFVLVLLDLHAPDDCLHLVNRLLKAVADPIHVDGMTLQVSASVGVSFYPQTGEEIDPDQLLRQADQAMYQAKQAGKNRHQIYDAEYERRVRDRHEGMECVRAALQKHELVLHYQPKVNMRSGQVLGVEALIRWQHPEQGLLPPAAFMPLIENSPLAVEVGQWVLETALSQFETWQGLGLHIPVSVNISAIHLQQPDFIDELRALIQRHPGAGPNALQIEVLETSALDDIALVSGTIEACRAMAIGFALDDFGTGYSSLNYLKRLPAEQLKIDQSFVRDMLEDANDLAILQGVLGLASAFRRQVIAEGVETEAHGKLLLQIGCDWGQGYAIARPMPPETLPAWAESWQQPATWAQATTVAPPHRELLFAIVAHRSWMAEFKQCLDQQRPLPPLMAAQHCELGKWLDKSASDALYLPESLAPIRGLHAALHRAASELCNPGQDRQPSKANIEALDAMSEQLLSALEQLLKEAPPRAGESGLARNGRHTV